MKKSIAFALLLIVGCGKKDAAVEEADDPGINFMAKSIADDVNVIKQKLAAGKAKDANLDCAQVENLPEARKAKRYAASMDEYEKLCTIDQPIGTLEEELAIIEPARKAKPDEKVLMECYDAYIDVTYRAMVKYKTVDKAKEYLDKYAALCPEEAKKTLATH